MRSARKDHTGQKPDKGLYHVKNGNAHFDGVGGQLEVGYVT